MEDNSLTKSHKQDPIRIRKDLDRLNRRDWWRWAAAMAIMLLTTSGVFALSLPNLRRGWEEQQQLDMAVLGLFALVLIFDIFSVYQQIEMNRMRRQFAVEMGMAATVEVLRPDGESRRSDADERRAPRVSWDHLLTLRAAIGERELVVYGRTSDISTDGLGAVIPEALPLGTEVTLKVSFGASNESLTLDAVVCHRRGFLHGFKFTRLTPAQSGVIGQICGDVPPSPTFRGSYGTHRIP